MKTISGMTMIIAILVSLGFALDESPGDQIGITYNDLQEIGNFGQRLAVDDYGQAHIVWNMRNDAGDLFYVAWNCRYANGSYYGGTQVSPTWSSQGQIDITRDVNPDDQKSVVVYIYDPGTGYYIWLDIDAGNCWGSWPNDPIQVAQGYQPRVCVANNNNIAIAYSDFYSDSIHLIVTTNQGSSWTPIADIDSCATLSHFVRSSRNSGSAKVVFVWTQFITDTAAGGQLDNDVYYMLSTDNGETWTSPINITNYQPTDSVRAYNCVNAAFDKDDNLHIVWAGRKVVNGEYYEASKIFHWDDLNNTITVVSSPSVYYSEPGGWWKTEPGAGDFGAWRMPADYPQLVADQATGHLYCLWHGNDDYNDYSAAGYINGEFYGSNSVDGGLTWSDYDSLTYTRSPGAYAGSCLDEDYMTANPVIVNDSIFVTYIEDKDAGSYSQGEGIQTENTVRCWVFPKDMIATGVKEEDHRDLFKSKPVVKIYPNPFKQTTQISFEIDQSSRDKANGIELKIFDTSGRLVKDLSIPTAYSLVSTVSWDATDANGHKVPSGIYFVHFGTGEDNTVRKAILTR